MTRLFAIGLLSLVAGAAVVNAQCDGPDTTVWGSSYALRTTADTVYTYSQSWATGPDAPYMYIWDYQSDYMNSSQIGSTLVGSTDPGGTAWVTRTTSVDTYGFGEYLTDSSYTAYDACTGLWAPPWYNAWAGTTSADVWAYRPTISGNSRLWLDNYGTNYPTSTTWTADTGGAPEIPTWYFPWNTNNVINLSCSICNSVTITPGPSANASCGYPLPSGYFMVGNLQSALVGVQIDGPYQTATSDPSTGQHTDNNAISSISKCRLGPPLGCFVVTQGYSSVWWWQVNDMCGAPMPSANMHEEFPSGFAYDPSNANSNWPFPVANSWQTDSSGVWKDTIGESTTYQTNIGPNIVPMPSVPQSPLTTNLVYSGLQDVYVGNNSPDSFNTLVFSGDQAHYLDHGGYIP